MSPRIWILAAVLFCQSLALAQPCLLTTEERTSKMLSLLTAYRNEKLIYLRDSGLNDTAVSRSINSKYLAPLANLERKYHDIGTAISVSTSNADTGIDEETLIATLKSDIAFFERTIAPDLLITTLVPKELKRLKACLPADVRPEVGAMAVPALGAQ